MRDDQPLVGSTPGAHRSEEVLVQGVGYLIGVVCALIVIADVWRSPAVAVTKIWWTILAIVFSVITLVVWLVWGRQRAYSSTTGVN